MSMKENMKKRRKWPKIAFIVSILLFVAVALFCTWPHLIAPWSLFVRHPRLATIWYDHAPDWEKRRVAHITLSDKYNPFWHDAFIILTDYGDESSVPILIDALSSPVLKEAIEKDFMSCTWAHCLEALKKLTGEDLGLNHHAWDEWWRTEGKHSKSKDGT